MSNQTTTDPPFYDLGLGVPLWVVIVWAAAGFLILTMVILIFYVCHTRKSEPSHDSEDEERRRSLATFENYPQSYIDELHTKQPINRQIFLPAFVHNMRIPRAVEVRMTDPTKNGRDYMPQQNVAEGSRISFEELDFNGYDYGHYDDEEFHHPNRRINISRNASFKTTNISEESKVKQLYMERMLVNELREKIRKEKRLDQEDRS